ncbi:maleylpyruvate isomerase family mycothiol-dependent enzyme [Kitasatospora sp. NPDC048365]|uniref:maleylpyruvate isomerase family mycothiol-dependent enzyme n=1 Tax=Kitasatospora sp. NPDC048365 TaxID=3364050 RepID=UPI003711D1B2
MLNNLHFSELLRLIDERSTAFRAAIAAAPDLDVQVPTCPEWTLYDLVQHLGVGRRAWAATVAAGATATGKAEPLGDPVAPTEREALDAWLAESTRLLLDALTDAGEDGPCWGWWGKSQTPLTVYGAARRQLHEIAVHTYDAQLAAGAPQPVPVEIALDGAEEFLCTIGTTTEAWPHEAAVVDYHATEGRSWRSLLSEQGSRLGAVPADAPEPADATAAGPANELLLALYGRIPFDTLKLEGQRILFDQLFEWDPER